MIGDKTRILIEKAAPYLFGAALFFLFWLLSPKPFSASDAAKMQNTIVQEVRVNEKITRSELQYEIDSLRKMQSVILLKNDSLAILAKQSNSEAKRHSDNLRKFKDELKNTFSNYRDSSTAAIVKRIQPK